MLLQVLNSNVIILIVFTTIVIIMKTTVPLTTLIETHGREVVAEMVGCHLTNINHVISNDREVYAVLDDGQIVHCFEIRKFPNRKISKAKKSKTPSVN